MTEGTYEFEDIFRQSRTKLNIILHDLGKNPSDYFFLSDKREAIIHHYYMLNLLDGVDSRYVESFYFGYAMHLNPISGQELRNIINDLDYLDYLDNTT